MKSLGESKITLLWGIQRVVPDQLSMTEFLHLGLKKSKLRAESIRPQVKGIS